MNLHVTAGPENRQGVFVKVEPVSVTPIVGFTAAPIGKAAAIVSAPWFNMGNTSTSSQRRR